MSIEQLAHPITSMTGHANLSRDDVEKRNEQFAQYLTAIKGAKLSETQLQKLGESKSNDERTRTIEKINEHKAQSDDEHYRKMRGNGYTVGETRRGLDQIDKALERKEAQSAERKAQSAECKVQSAECRDQSAEIRDQSAERRDEENNLCDLRSAFCDFKSLTSDADNASVQQAGDVIANDAGNGLRENASASTMRNAVEQMAVNASEQQANRYATSAGKTAASLAAAMAGMTPVAQSETVRRSGRQASDFRLQASGRNNEYGSPKSEVRSLNDNVTQEALTAASEIQQAANDLGQSQHDPNAAQAAKDAAVTQTLPNTSLMERLDQARLTNRVASAFRSLANQSGTIRMKLHPEELGALTIRMQIEGGQVSAKLEAETETAKQVLLENIETLKKKLKEQNLEVQVFDVEVVSKESNRTNSKFQIGQSVAKNKGKAESEHVDFYF